MVTLDTVSWIAIALLVPFWWGMSLLVLAVLGDLSSWWRPRVSRLFAWLERTREEPNEAAHPALSSVGLRLGD